MLQHKPCKALFSTKLQLTFFLVLSYLCYNKNKYFMSKHEYTTIILHFKNDACMCPCL